MASKVCLTLVVLLALSPAAYAYIDPGTGSYLFQLLIAGLLGGGFLVKAYWRHLRRWVARVARRREKTVTGGGDDERA